MIKTKERGYPERMPLAEGEVSTRIQEHPRNDIHTSRVVQLLQFDLH